MTIYGISGYRTPAHCVAVGGYADDPHTKGEAEDIGVNSLLRSSAAQISEAELRRFGLYRPFDPSDDPGNTEVNHVQMIPAGGPPSLAVSRETWDPDPIPASRPGGGPHAAVERMDGAHLVAHAPLGRGHRIDRVLGGGPEVLDGVCAPGSPALGAGRSGRRVWTAKPERFRGSGGRRDRKPERRPDRPAPAWPRSPVVHGPIPGAPPQLCVCPPCGPRRYRPTDRRSSTARRPARRTSAPAPPDLAGGRR